MQAQKSRHPSAHYGSHADTAPPPLTDVAASRELQEDLDSAPQHPELISDWKLLRFLRGHGEVQAAAAAFRRMLAYRVERDVDAARVNAVNEGSAVLNAVVVARKSF